MPKKVGDLQVWWIPQVPMKSFKVPVSTVEEAVKIMDTLANYDLFQFENNIKPDYANMGGLEVWADDEDCQGRSWCSWCDEDTGIEDPREYIDYLKDKS